MDTDLPGQAAVHTIAGIRTELEAPTSYAERWEVYNALQDASIRDAPQEVVARLLAGALGLCCARLRRYLAKQRIEYNGDLRKYGAAVVDFHAEQPGAGPRLMAEIVAAGRAAQKLCEESLLTKAQLQAAQGFSKAPGESSSSSSSPSSAPGAAIPDGSAPYSQSVPQG